MTDYLDPSGITDEQITQLGSRRRRSSRPDGGVMFIYLLKRTVPKNDPVAHYEEALSFVVVANDVDEARELAASKAGVEGPEIWRQKSARVYGLGQFHQIGLPKRMHKPHVVCCDSMGA